MMPIASHQPRTSEQRSTTSLGLLTHYQRCQYQPQQIVEIHANLAITFSRTLCKDKRSPKTPNPRGLRSAPVLRLPTPLPEFLFGEQFLVVWTAGWEAGNLRQAHEHDEPKHQSSSSQGSFILSMHITCRNTSTNFIMSHKYEVCIIYCTHLL